ARSSARRESARRPWNPGHCRGLGVGSRNSRSGLQGLGVRAPAVLVVQSSQEARVKILHTSDWHVGKVLKGKDRHDEHEAVLRSIVGAAREHDVDLVLVAGDLFETAAPTARSQGLVMRTLLALREDGRQVVVIAGNHDNAALLDSVYRP